MFLFDRIQIANFESLNIRVKFWGELILTFTSKLYVFKCEICIMHVCFFLTCRFIKKIIKTNYQKNRQKKQTKHDSQKFWIVAISDYRENLILGSNNILPIWSISEFANTFPTLCL